MDSKKLSINDTSGDLFSKNVFSNKMYKDMEISFDRIQFDYKDNNWLFIDHILIDKPVDSIEELPIDIKSKIMRTIEFTKKLNKKKAPCFSYGDEFLFLLTFL